MKNKFIVLAIPLFIMACSPSAEEKQSAKIKDFFTPSQTQANNASTTPNETKEPETFTADLPEGNKLPSTLGNNPQGLQDTSGYGSITKKKKTTTPETEQEKKVEKQIIQTADIKIQVKNLDYTADTIDLIAKKYGAYISSSNQETSNGVAEGKICIRVKQESFSALIKDVMKQSIFTNYKNIRTDDVSAEYVDIVSRLKTKKEVEARYMDILRSKAHSIQEVLHAENEIRIVHEEIEAKTGRLNLLKDQVAYSTINLEFYQQTAFLNEPAKVVQVSYFNDLGNAFGSGWNFIKRLVIVLTFIWPLYVFLIILYLILRKYVFAKTKKIS